MARRQTSVNCRERETRPQPTTASSRRPTLSGKNLWCGPETAARNGDARGSCDAC